MAMYVLSMNLRVVAKGLDVSCSLLLVEINLLLPSPHLHASNAKSRLSALLATEQIAYHSDVRDFVNSANGA